MFNIVMLCLYYDYFPTSVCFLSTSRCFPIKPLDSTKSNHFCKCLIFWFEQAAIIMTANKSKFQALKLKLQGIFKPCSLNIFAVLQCKFFCSSPECGVQQGSILNSLLFSKNCFASPTLTDSEQQPGSHLNLCLVQTCVQ